MWKACSRVLTFLFKSTRRKMELGPEYLISAIFSMAALACRTGIEQRTRMLARMTASLKVQSPSYHRR